MMPLPKRVQDFFPIEINEFVSSKQLDLELYLCVDEKFIKIVHSGEELDQSRIEKYRQKEAHYLYVTRADYEKYLAFHLKLASAVAKTNAVPEEKRLQLVRHANDIILQQIFREGMDEKAFTYARAITEINLSMLAKRQDLFAALEVLTASGDFLFAHALGVSVYSTMLAPALNCGSASVVTKIGLGAMLHDLGLKDVPYELLERPVESYTEEEAQIYRQHPLQGLQMLQSIEGVPHEVLVIVAQHHEYRDGSGFPAGMAGAQVSPLAKMIGVADEFCEMILKYPGRDLLNPKEAITSLMSSRTHVLDSRIVETLGRVLGVRTK